MMSYRERALPLLPAAIWFTFMIGIKRVIDLLLETIVRAKENVEKKQALTYEEMEAEREEEEVQAESESDDDEQQIYNPLKLPMGWDGKPIPYWLYKLHGLGQVPP